MTGHGFWKGRDVFITGHTGFKGAWLSKVLGTMGANVTGYALAPLSKENLFELIKPQIRSIIGDVRDFDKLLAAYKAASPEIVIHMAAQPLVLESYRNPRYTYETNVMGTVNILECARLHQGAKSILNITTDKVYLNLERREGYSEDERLFGRDPYSNSKSCSELVTESYKRSFCEASGTAISTARSGNVIGGGDFSENRLIPDCARAAAHGVAAILRNPGSVRPYQHVFDTLSAYLLIARRQFEEPSLASCYNVGPYEKDCVTSGRLADMFCEAWGKGARWTYTNAESPHESGLLTLDCSKIKKALGWTPRWDIGQSVKVAARWYAAYYGGELDGVMQNQIDEFLKFGL